MYQSSIIWSFLFFVFINYFYDKLIKVVSFERNCGAASVWGWWLYYRIILVLSTRNSYGVIFTLSTQLIKPMNQIVLFLWQSGSGSLSCGQTSLLVLCLKLRKTLTSCRCLFSFFFFLSFTFACISLIHVLFVWDEMNRAISRREQLTAIN